MPKDLTKSRERLTAEVYGDTFKLYNEGEFREFLAPLNTRFLRNQLELSVFENARCLDAGCGGGRGSVFMAERGARRVDAVDLSEANVASTAHWAQQFELPQIHPQLANLCELPFPDNSFDVVWCNGVLHHSEDPDAGLAELSRVLKPGGSLWLYLYGSGGIYWALIDEIRSRLGAASVSATIARLLTWGTPTGRIAEFIDDWFVPWIRRYTHADVAGALASLGFESPQLLRRGTDYDTSQRVHVHQESALWGGGDIRYFCVKNGTPKSQQICLPGKSTTGSIYKDDSVVEECMRACRDLFDLSNTIAAAHTTLAPLQLSTGLAAQLQTQLRDMMSEPDEFRITQFSEFVAERHRRLKLIQ